MLSTISILYSTCELLLGSSLHTDSNQTPLRVQVVPTLWVQSVENNVRHIEKNV